MQLPFVKRSTMEAAVQKVRNIEQNRARLEQEHLKEEWQKKWEPLLKDAIRIRAERKYELDTYILHIGIDRYMIEMVSMRNDAADWEYMADMLAHELRRQMATLNFSGLHKLAKENERRYPEIREPTPWK